MSIDFTTAFPGGNGHLVSTDESDTRVLVHFAAELRNCAEAIWFHFRVTGLGGRSLRCVLANPEQTLERDSPWSHNAPVYRADDGAWTRCAPPAEAQTPSGRRLWAWDVPPARDVVEFAVCYPYQLDRLEELVSDVGEVFSSETIGFTPGNRAIRRLSNDVSGPTVPGVFLAARHHAGETPGSWVLDGLVHHVAATAALCDTIGWHIVPMVNLDDLVAGSYGKDPWPHDCNRGYAARWFLRGECQAVARDVERAAERCRPMLGLDLHAPSHAERQVYAHIGDPDGTGEIAGGRAFAEQYHANLPDELKGEVKWQKATASNSRQPGMGWGRWMRHRFGILAMTLEYTYQGVPGRDFTTDDYRRLGAVLADTIAQWIEAQRWCVRGETGREDRGGRRGRDEPAKEPGHHEPA